MFRYPLNTTVNSSPSRTERACFNDTAAIISSLSPGYSLTSGTTTAILSRVSGR